MGLDSIWQLPKGVSEPIFNPPLRLCGGMLSGNGAGSFRGKVYDDFINEITGESLYQQAISNHFIAIMANQIEQVTDTDLVSAEELNDLKRMFRAYADAGATLCGWW